MKALNKLYVEITNGRWIGRTSDVPQSEDSVEFIRKDYLLEWLDKEFDRLYELIPDASNENPSQMELRYLSQYMQMEKLIDKLNEI